MLGVTPPSRGADVALGTTLLVERTFSYWLTALNWDSVLKGEQAEQREEGRVVQSYLA